jgi:hypothetical protein
VSTFNHITVLALLSQPLYSDIMRDNAIINLTGLEGDCMPIDLNIEHLIGELKVGLVDFNYISTGRS